MEEFPWYSVAKSLVGVEEVSGKIDNEKIVELFRIVGHVEIKDDETAWCAAFVGSCLELAGYKSTRSLAARSYLKFGEKIPEPREGCIVVFWRESKTSAKGHVGFYAGRDDRFIRVLGGNQSNGVRVQGYPAERLLACVMPVERGAVATSALIANIDQIRAARDEGSAVEGANIPMEPLPSVAVGIPGSGGNIPPPDNVALGGGGGNNLPPSDGDADDGDDDARGLLGDEDADDPVRSANIPVIQFQSWGEQVKDLQLKLKEKGFALGNVDGIFGPMTQQAVFEFQKANSLESSGIVDQRTLDALFGGKGPDLPEERRKAGAADLLTRGSEIIRNARQGQWGAVATGVIAAFGFGDTLGLTKLLGGTGQNDMISKILGTGGGMWGAIAAIAAIAWWKFNSAAEKRVQDHRSGANRRI
jgi:uncharacterized protein (TIGR02594 family)